MMRTIRTITATGAVVGALLLGGCSALLPEVYGPERGPDGRVAEATEAAATFLTVGDCFGFPVEGDLARVTLVPCAQSHDWEVIAQGDLTLREEKELGVQNAVSGHCADPFAAFEAANADGAPWQQFLLSEAKRGERTVTVYTCVATVTVPEP